MMNKYVYSVLRFVPNPTNGEFVNIGAIVGSDEIGEWELSTVGNLKRARKLDINGILPKVFSILNDIGRMIDEFVEAEGELIPTEVEISENWLQELYEKSQNVVQLSLPSPMLAEDLNHASQRVFDEFIIDPAKKQVYITKIRAITSVRRAYFISHVPKENIIERVEFEASHHSGRLDFVVANGTALQLTQAWSFQMQDQEELNEQIKSWAWTIEHLRRFGGRLKSSNLNVKIPDDVKIGVVYVPPANGGPKNVFSEAEYAFKELNADMFEFDKANVVGEEATQLLKKAH